ncbi:MAG: glycosyltransferase [Thermodesulfobacteriota bacterium]
MPTISIVVPSYNHAGYVEACLDSIYFQDYPDIEMIIVDDCSTDGSTDIISGWIGNVGAEEVSFAAYYNEKSDAIERTVHRRYEKPGRKIVFETNTANLGSTKTYNRGFRLATGELCSFIASDDIIHPHMLSTLSGPLINDEADFVYADMFIIDDNHRILREFRLPDYSFERSFCDWYLCGVATLYRRSLHERFGYYDETSAADDHECYLRFAMNGARFLHVPKTLYSVRSHDRRQVGLHEAGRFTMLLEESKRLTLKARRWLAGNASR